MEDLIKEHGHMIGRSFTCVGDGFTGTCIGLYKTREGRSGAVIQQDGTRIVHIYHIGRLEPV